MKKPLIKNKILEILRRDGKIDNFFCIDTRLTTRLGAFIHILKTEGKIEIDEEKSGYIKDSKNYQYVVKPFKVKETPYYVNGELVHTKREYLNN